MSEPLPDLASSALHATVIAASDEFFAAKENLVKPSTPTFAPYTFGTRGQVYDGWETRRRRTPGHDWVIVQLGSAGIVRRVVVDTAHFTGNYPQSCAVDAAAVDGYPDHTELTGWTPLVGQSELTGDTRHEFIVSDDHRYTHVRLRIFPDGGVARLRVHGEVRPDPREVAGRPVDLVAVGFGGRALDCSDSYFSVPANLLLPDPARVMGEGWETQRRRGDGNDWAELALGAQGVPELVEIDARHFLGNAPGAVRLTGFDGPGAGFVLLPDTRLQPGTLHRFRIPDARPTSRVRVDILPDGGLGRLRLYGSPTGAGMAALTRRWFTALPADQAQAVLPTLPDALREWCDPEHREPGDTKR